MYYRDEIGNISTSHLWGDSKKVSTFTSSEMISINIYHFNFVPNFALLFSMIPDRTGD